MPSESTAGAITLRRRGPDEPPSPVRCDVAPCRRNPRHTTRHQHIPEKVIIVRARHPFEGQSLNVFGAVHRKGRRLLVLILPDGSKSLVPADWTDLVSPAHPRTASTPTALGSLENLLHARAVVDALLDRLASATGEEGHSTKESVRARNASKSLGSAPRPNLSLGNPGRTTHPTRHSDPREAHRPSRSGSSGEGNHS
jgi:hypothetical protein